MLLITAMMDGWIGMELQLRLLDERWRLRVERCPIVNQSNREPYCLDISIETIECLNSTCMAC